MQKINNNLHFTLFTPLSIFLHIVVESKRSFYGAENALCSPISNEEAEGQNDNINTHIWRTGLDSHLVSASPPPNLFRWHTVVALGNLQVQQESHLPFETVPWIYLWGPTPHSLTLGDMFLVFGSTVPCEYPCYITNHPHSGCYNL